MLTLVFCTDAAGMLGRSADNCTGGRGRPGNEIPWQCPADLCRVTAGHTLIMGRHTLELLGRVLPDRRHIVVSRSPANFVPPPWAAAAWASKTLRCCDSLAAAVRLALEHDAAPCMVGGAQVYGQCLRDPALLARVGRVNWTRLSATVEGCDVRLPLTPLQLTQELGFAEVSAPTPLASDGGLDATLHVYERPALLAALFGSLPPTVVLGGLNARLLRVAVVRGGGDVLGLAGADVVLDVKAVPTVTGLAIRHTHASDCRPATASALAADGRLLCLAARLDRALNVNAQLSKLLLMAMSGVDRIACLKLWAVAGATEAEVRASALMQLHYDLLAKQQRIRRRGTTAPQAPHYVLLNAVLPDGDDGGGTGAATDTGAVSPLAVTVGVSRNDAALQVLAEAVVAGGRALALTLLLLPPT